jgi:arsenate reductase-like glutaredoxin family protein
VVPETKVAVQIFGYRDSRTTQQAIRFFRERRVSVAFVDLSQRAIARGELQRFTQKFGALRLFDETSKAYRESGLAYIRLDETDAFDRLLTNPRLLKLPLVRFGSSVAIGADETVWRGWLTQA